MAYGDGRKHIHNAVILGLAPTGLVKLRLDAACAPHVPGRVSRRHGPSVARARILGDDGWSMHRGSGCGADLSPAGRLTAFLLLDAESPGAAVRTCATGCATAWCGTVNDMVVEVPFVSICPTREPPPRSSGGSRSWSRSVSSTACRSRPIRGTYKALPRCRPNPPSSSQASSSSVTRTTAATSRPVPTMQAIHDPDNVLPIAADAQQRLRAPDRQRRSAISGATGAFLAVRQLEQDVDGFWNYCADAAMRTSGQQFPRWVDVNAEFVGAKMVGRWQYASSLVRFPYHARQRVVR